MAAREEILGRFFKAYQTDPTLTPTAYMLEAEKGNNTVTYRGKVYHNTKYKNADSARRQFTKIRTGETSGEKLYRQSVEYYPRQYRAPGTKGQPVKKYMGRPAALPEKGIFKVTVHFEYDDSDGVHVEAARSFIVFAQYESAYDIPYLQEILQDQVDKHLESWARSKQYDFRNVQQTSIEIEKAQSTTKSRYDEGVVTLNESDDIYDSDEVYESGEDEEDDEDW
jgi:hypothetical protein